MSAFAGCRHTAMHALGGAEHVGGGAGAKNSSSCKLGLLQQNRPLADLRSAANIGTNANHRSLQPSL
jgi:hypothetical protein